MGVVLVFLRRLTPDPGRRRRRAAVAGGAPWLLMWFSGFSLDNLSLMAITISVGFVVDDAIVMIENVTRNMEGGHGAALSAAVLGTRQIGFTVDLDQRLAHRRLRAAAVHARAGRRVLPRVLADADLCGGGVDHRVAHAHADALRPFHRATRRAGPPARLALRPGRRRHAAPA